MRCGGLSALPLDIIVLNAYNAIMGTLNIRNLPEDVHRRLRVRAAQAGRSMEAEAREILTEACGKDARPGDVRDLQDFVRKLYAKKRPTRVVDDLIAERRREAAAE